MNNPEKNFENTSSIEIEPTGSYFEIDDDGRLVNPTSEEKLQEEWKPIIDDIVSAYRKEYGEKLHSVYVRGSVAKGEAVKGVSDVDTFAYVDVPKGEIEHEWSNTVEKELGEKYPFSTKVEMCASLLSEFEDDTIILNQSLCVWGEEKEVPRLQVGGQLAIHAPNFHNRLEWFNKFLEKDETEEELKSGCEWLAKGLLRVGFEITMERSQKYTRDLYRCYETFAEYYPEKEAEMREVLYLALNPTSDREKIKQMMDNFRDWLLQETPKHCEVNEQ